MILRDQVENEQLRVDNKNMNSINEIIYDTHISNQMSHVSLKRDYIHVVSCSL